ncbi:hypothetical protein P167DRAFT_303490 [Morchella conica CCBAS932]|uniref:Uncharacterized protein n=1 Tax=Morchella conica CCBAS932 TaxID=1392247 RepID=A0A3N4KJ69_9PEZI|nr:hypothetical protein P167DRAFT_303490 [Morchella conica CCBAS932]
MSTGHYYYYYHHNHNHNHHYCTTCTTIPPKQHLPWMLLIPVLHKYLRSVTESRHSSTHSQTYKGERSELGDVDRRSQRRMPSRPLSRVIISDALAAGQ